MISDQSEIYIELKTQSLFQTVIQDTFMMALGDVMVTCYLNLSCVCLAQIFWMSKID